MCGRDPANGLAVRHVDQADVGDVLDEQFRQPRVGARIVQLHREERARARHQRKSKGRLLGGRPGRLLTLDHADPIQHLGAEASERLQHSQVLRAQDGRSIKRQVEVSRQMALQEEGGNERRAIGGKALVLEWWRR